MEMSIFHTYKYLFDCVRNFQLQMNVKNKNEQFRTSRVKNTCKLFFSFYVCRKEHLEDTYDGHSQIINADATGCQQIFPLVHERCDNKFCRMWIPHPRKQDLLTNNDSLNDSPNSLLQPGH